jgi:hypothetical protein
MIDSHVCGRRGRHPDGELAVTDQRYRLIKRHYEQSQGNSIELFRAILEIAQEIGPERALTYLERCVTEKRLLWLEENLDKLDRSGNPLLDGYRAFYEVYLGVSAPADGQVVEVAEGRLVTRWWNRCPTLEACQALGLDTREVCAKAYHRPVEAFLARIDPRLGFERNYEALRPYTCYCEEAITLRGTGRQV